MASGRPAFAGLVGVGYEGRTVEDLVAQLLAEDVSRLFEVRLNPLSRKRGLSKTAPGEALGRDAARFGGQ